MLSILTHSWNMLRDTWFSSKPPRPNVYSSYKKSLPEISLSFNKLTPTHSFQKNDRKKIEGVSPMQINRVEGVTALTVLTTRSGQWLLDNQNFLYKKITYQRADTQPLGHWSFNKTSHIFIHHNKPQCLRLTRQFLLYLLAHINAKLWLTAQSGEHG